MLVSGILPSPRLVNQLICATLFCLVGLSLPAFAATYYVDCDAGNNSNSGTSSGSPWLTLTYARDQVGAGDTVKVLTSTCTLGSGGVTFDGKRGSSGSPIIFEEETGHTVVVKNPSNWKSQSNGNGFRFENNSGWIEIRGFEIRDTWFCTWAQDGSDNILIEDVDCHFTWRGGHRVRGNSRDITYRGGSVYNTNQNLVSTGSGNGEAFYIGGNSGTGLGDDADFIIVENVTIGPNVRQDCINIKGDSEDITIRNNTIFDGCNGAVNGQSSAIVIQESVDNLNADHNLLIYGNTIYNIYSDQDKARCFVLRTGATIYNNFCYDTESAGVTLGSDLGNDASSQVNLWNNTFWQNPGGTIENSHTSCSNRCDIRGNLGYSASNNKAAVSSYFVNVAGASSTWDLHIVETATAIIDNAPTIASVTDDIDGDSRTTGEYDFGADEYAPPPSPPSGSPQTTTGATITGVVIQ